MGKFYSMSDFYPDMGIPTTTDKTIPESAENQYYNNQVVTSPDNITSTVPKNWIMGAFGIIIALVVVLHFLK